ncbi:hypothetical protein [Agromyces sp. NBRC 114283]|uniref:hypothetical protein n=1 Tax=Agromyces sp. NBRC 114283 TaxID=2994521 RepID=UPI0024A4892C|nr:hypothetical protein [Agromyces sp. NBRC 114283]GLU88890.1 hypothetical protein Agsp01_11450 [Agromyces sp. NBRC 114283]
MSRIAYDLAGAAEQASLSVRSIKEAIDSDGLEVHYAGKKRTKPLIHHDDLSEYIKKLPTIRGTT